MSTQNNGDMSKLLEKINAVAQQSVQAPSGQTQKQAYETYIEQLIEERGFPDLTAEVKEELKKDLVNRLDSFIGAKVIATLSDEDVLKFEQLLKDGKSREEIQKFTVEHVPDFTTFLTNVLMEFRMVYLGLVQAPVSVDVDFVNGAQKANPAVVAKPLQKMPPAPVAPAPVSSDSDKKVN